MQYFTALSEPSNSTTNPIELPNPSVEATVTDPDDPNNVSPNDGNSDAVPDNTVCQDARENVFCQTMKKRGCKRLKLAEKSCRKSCDLCGKNIYLKNDIFEGLLNSFFQRILYKTFSI